MSAFPDLVDTPVGAALTSAPPPPAREPIRVTVARLAAAQKPALGAPAYSRFINRRMGRVLAAGAFWLRLTPNTVTGISAACTFSAIAVLALVHPSVAVGLAISALLVIGYALDAADGQLARLRGGGSLAGEWLDHMVDATKIATLHLAVLVWLYRWVALPSTGWLLVPLGFSVVAEVAFFATILGDQLRRRSPAGAPTYRRSAVRALLAAPTDYGLLCLAFVLLGAPLAFLGVYTVLFAGSAGYLLLAVAKWYHDMRGLDHMVHGMQS